MKRTNFKLQTSNIKLQTLLFAALFSTIVFTSCSSDKDETTTPTETFADKIIGRWMCTGVDGRPCPTNYYYVMNFVSPTKVYRSYSPTTSIGLDNFWEAQYECVAKITDRKLTVTGQHNVNLTSESQYSLQSITETEMDLVANHTVIFKGRQIDMPAHNHERFTKITKDYSKDIIGTWEGHITSNESAYDDGELHRWEYKTDGTYVYYSQNSDGQWISYDDEYAKYFVDGVLLCARWKNNGEDTEQREWWEIESIQNGVMKWTALRKRDNGTTYTASFQMTKVK